MRDFIAKSRFDFRGILNSFMFYGIQGLSNVFDEVDYLHFTLISDGKVIAS